MPGGQLPEGLVTTNNHTVGQEIGNVDRVDFADVARLWRDYSTSRALLHDNIGERLANFFWRIWSNHATSSAIPGSTVARLFMTISQGGNRVRTTPVPSTRSTSPISHDTTPTPSSPQVVAEPVSTANVSNLPSIASPSPPTATEPASEVGRTSRASTGSPPIFKSTGPVSESTSTSSRSPMSPPATPSPTSSTKPMNRSLSNGSRKKAIFVTASGARAKTKPSLPRRKGSQGASSANGEPRRSPGIPARKSPSRSPSLKQSQAELANLEAPAIAPPPGLPSIALTLTSFALPSPSWKDASSPATSQRGPPGATGISQQPSSWLVDTNFRSKFVENQIRGASSADLSGLVKSRSTVRFADQLPGRRATSGALDTQTSLPGPKAARDAATTNAQTRPRRGSEAVADDDDDVEGILPLPRTKSQLSMMIEQERRKSGTHELRPSPLQQEVHKGNGDQTTSKPNDGEDDEEEDELLTMGRKDGITRAGVISSNTRGKQNMSRKGSDKFRYQSPPTSPLSSALY